MIDWHQIDDLKQTIGAEAFAEVVVLFLEEADQSIARLKSPQDLPGIAKELHGLKGISLNLGFTALAQLCQQLEQRAEAGGQDLPIEEVNTCYTASRADFVGRLALTAA